MTDPNSTREPLTIAVDPCASRGQVAVTVRGEIDLANAEALQQRLASVIDGDAVDLVLDVSGVSFCDVPALNVILHAQSLLLSRGGRLRLHGDCRPIRIMVRVLALQDELPMATPDGVDQPPSTSIDEGEQAS